MAPFLEEKVQFKLPIKNEGVQASVPVSTSYFYYDAFVKSCYSNQVQLCDKNELPIFRRDLLNKELDIDLLSGWDRDFETMQRLSVRGGGNDDATSFNKSKWLNWICALDQKKNKILNQVFIIYR